VAAILRRVRRLFPTLARNRRLVALFALMVVLPGFIFSALMVRAISNEQLRLAYGRIERQREIVRHAEAQLNAWLFSAAPDSARSLSLLRFTTTGDEIAFPDFDLVLPAAAAPRLRPFDAAPVGGELRADAVTTHYYPRVQVFLRDSHAGRHTGAQYFLRLRALVVQTRGDRDGYVIGSDPVVSYVNERLSELCKGESFAAQVWVAQAERSAARTSETYGLADFPFFEVAFTESGVPAALAVRQNAFTYSMTALIAIAVLGSVFVHRAVSQEVKLAELRKDFVAAVSHEFRSPLSSIALLAERLVSQRTMAPGQLAEYHRVIESDARRLSALVSRLLEFGRIEEGKAMYHFAVVDLADVTRDVIEPSAHRPSSRVCFEPVAGPLWIRGDRTAISHAVQNLIENANKYSAPATPIDVTCSSGDGTHVIEVRDRGMGIAPADQPRIFEKFYRSPAVMTSGVQGVGVGLALVKHIVEAHGGSVSVRSRVGEGSVFRLAFPAVEA
jgi:signal transduction histidine kinase